jgi:hypothetical protein
MRTFNLLPNSSALMRSNTSGNLVSIASYTHGWTALNGSINVIGTNYIVDTRYVLEIIPIDASSVVLTLEDVPLKIRDNSRVLSFNLKIRANSSFTVQSKLYLDGDDSGIEANTQNFSSGRYNAVETNRVVVPDDEETHTATIRLTISGHETSTIYATLPHLIHDMQFYGNSFVSQMRNFFPDFYWEIDSDQSAPTYPFFKLVDALTAAAGDTKEVHDAIYPAENSQLSRPDIQNEYWTQSTLVSWQTVKDDYAPWLAQFSGHKLYRNFQYGGGETYFNNPSLMRDFLEWQIRTSSFGRNAGTRQAMMEAVKQVLVRTKDGTSSTFGVAITPRSDGDPFAINIQTLTNETIDASAGESSALVLQAVNLAKPLGYKVTHITVDEFFFTLDDPSLGVLDSLRWG